MEITEEQIEAWKKEHTNVYCITVGNKKCYLKKPERRALSLSMNYEKQDPLKADEVLLKSCWLAGDEEIQTNMDLFLSIRDKMAGLFELKQSELVKL